LKENINRKFQGLEGLHLRFGRMMGKLLALLRLVNGDYETVAARRKEGQDPRKILDLEAVPR